MEFITFLLAMIGYAGLTAVVLLSARGHLPVALWRVMTLVITAHVTMVWAYRYQWQLAQATRNGYGGFLMFHSALLMIIASVFLGEGKAVGLVRISFLIVTVGALGAVFLYEVVSIYRIPVIACAGIGSIGLLRTYKRWKLANAKAA